MVKPDQKTVFVGLSGGVDSSVAAALLQKAGYDTCGVYMQNWTQDVAGVECPWKEDLASAKAVAAALDIPFRSYDFQAEYKQKVVDYMVAEYEAGRTPNPDIMCNQEIKFKLFLESALADGADMIATGHYAQIQASGIRHQAVDASVGRPDLSLNLFPELVEGSSDQRTHRNSEAELHIGVDAAKDQTYFLYRITAGALAQTLMPVGGYAKIQIRELAKQFGLPTANKPDSQGLCFVGEVGLRDFLSQYVDASPGNIIDKTGRVLGEHDGAIFYTIGQRHGLGVGGGKPFYVISKNMSANTVTVTDNPADLTLMSNQFNISDTSWINAEPKPGKYQVRTRYRAPLISCELIEAPNGYHIKMDRTDRAITPGQSAVIYQGTRVVGGGIITS